MAGCAIRRDKGGELRRAKWEFKITALGNFEGVMEPIGMLFASGTHSLRQTKMIPTAHALFWMRLAQERQRPDALKNVIALPVGGSAVMDGRRHDGREWSAFLRARDHLIKRAGKQIG